MISINQLELLYQEACAVDVNAFKPGNVSIYADGHDMTAADFITSAKVSAPALCNPDYSLGEKVFYSVAATRAAVGCNTNLGIILLCAPLVVAVQLEDKGFSLRDSLKKVLATTTIADANWVFKAITLASPGGLGEAPEQDVKTGATVTLTEAMRIAADKDRIALQYVSGYKDIFDCSVLSYNQQFNRWSDKNWAAVSVYAHLLSLFPDSHIERKFGDQYSEMVKANMALLSQAFTNAENPGQLLPMLHEFDQMFKASGINPGTTADMTVATVFAVTLEDFISRC